MITTFLETGNGTVVIDGLEPQPISGRVQTADAAPHLLVTFQLPRDASGVAIDGVYGGEILVLGRNLADSFNNLSLLTVNRNLGVTVVQDYSTIHSFLTAYFAGASITTAVTPDGDVQVLVNLGAVAPASWTSIGIVQAAS